MSNANIARSKERVDYYLWNGVQSIAIFASSGSSGLYWAYLMTQATGAKFESFIGVFSFAVAMAIMVTLEGFKALEQRKDGKSRDRYFNFFVIFSIMTGLATLMINAEQVGNERTKSSTVYQQAKISSEEADKQAAKYAWAKNLDIAELKKQADAYKAQTANRANGKPSGLTVGAVLSNPSKYKSYQHYQAGLDDITKQIEARRAYDSAMESKKTALTSMGENSSGATVTGLSSQFDWFINGMAGLLHLEGMTFLIMFYLSAIWLMERGGASAGRQAYYAGIKYREGKQQEEDVRNLANLGYIPRHLNARAEALAKENAQLRMQMVGAITLDHEPAQQLKQKTRMDALADDMKDRVHQHKNAGSGLPELTASIRMAEEKIKSLSDEAQQRVKKAVEEQAEKIEEWTKKQAKNAYGNAHFAPPKQAPSTNNTGSLAVDFGRVQAPVFSDKFIPEGERRAGDKKKANIQKNAVKKPSTPVKKKAPKRRTTVTADTGTTGKNAKRYRALVKAVQAKKVKPTQRGILGFKYGGKGMGRSTADKYKEALKRDGII